jgi:DNA-binding NarL/FixJ family response regulator
VPPHLAQLIPLLAECLPRDQIAQRIGTTRYAVDARLQRLYRLLGAHNRVQAVRIANEIGILPTIGDPR